MSHRRLLTGAVTRVAALSPAARALACDNADDVPRTSTISHARDATLCLLNQVRGIAKLRKLRNRPLLRRVAAGHAGDMVTRKFFDHNAPPVPASTFAQRLRAGGWKRSGGENLGFGTAYYATPRAMMWAWMHSTSHRDNILDPAYRWVGIAVSIGAPTGDDQFAATYTTDFGGR